MRSTSHVSSMPLSSVAHEGPRAEGAQDAREALLNDWLSESGADTQYDIRHRCAELLREAMPLTDVDEAVELDVEDLGRLELPPHERLRAAGVTAPRLMPVVDFSESQGAEALEQSLNALEVQQLSVSRLANGQLPQGCRLDSVRTLDLSMTQGRVDLAPLLRSVAAWPALEAVVLPSHARPSQAPSGWSYDHARCLVPDRQPASASDPPEDSRQQASPKGAEINRFFQSLKDLLRWSTAVAAPTIRGHLQRLQEVQRSVAARPELHAAVQELLSQQSGSCVDAGLRRLDDIQMLLHCGRLTSTADAGPAALRLALLRRADQSQAVGHRDDSENIERANALRVLIDQRLNALVGGDMPTASAPVYARLAGLRDVAPGATPGPRDWPADLRAAADAVFQGEVADGFPSLQVLLAEEEGAGALISGLLARDPSYQADAASLEAAFQRDYAAAQDADPDNPMAGLELHAGKEQALAQRRLALLAPWTEQLSARVREHLAASQPDSPPAE